MTGTSSFESSENDRLILFVDTLPRELQGFRDTATAEEKCFAEESLLGC